MGEKNIVVNWGQPQTSPSDSNRGSHRDVPAGYGLSSRGDFLSQDFDNSDYISFWLQEMWAKEAEAAREKEAAAIIATEVAKRDAEAAQTAEQQASERAQLKAEKASAELAERQAREAANELLQRQAEDSVRKIAQRLADEANSAAKTAAAERQQNNAAEYIKHTSDAKRFWSVIASPNAPTIQVPGVLERASDLAKTFFIRKATKTLGRQLPLLAALYPSNLALAERASQVFTTPASELGASNADLGFIASKKGTVDVTHRLMPDIRGDRLEWREVDGVLVGSRVRVRPAVYDPRTNTYSFTRDGETTPSLIWTPQISPTSSSTTLPVAPRDTSAYPGAEITSAAPQLNLHPEHATEPDDYIVDLPAELGLENPYIYFKNPRQIPGIASGFGQPITGIWLGDSTRTQGAPIPSQIADKLRGRRFSDFNKMREAIWAEVANDPVLSMDFSKRNLSLMLNGDAPFPREEDQRGGRKKFEIHHIDEIAKGGEVYDFSNMVIMTPSAHINHHGKN
jgi:hypothetical protein